LGSIVEFPKRTADSLFSFFVKSELMSEEKFGRILDAIYDAAAAPELWSVALEGLSGFFGCSIATLIDRNIKTSHGHGVAVGVDAPSQLEFFSVWGARNPFVQALQRVTPNAIDTDQHILPKSKLMMSDYYNGFMRQRDMHSLLRFTLQKDQDCHQSISIMGPRSMGDFGTDDVERSRMFLPHLQRSAKVARHLTASASLMQAVHNTLEVHADGVMILNRLGQILFANRMATSMASASDSFVLRRKRILALRSDDNNELQRLIAAAVGSHRAPLDARGDATQLSRSNGARSYIAVVAPLPGSSALHEATFPVAYIVVSDPTKSPSGSLPLLKKLYRLTPAEVRIVERIKNGDTPEQAAEALQVGIATARTHLSSIFHKTDVKRQSELVKLLANLPAVPK
jgi:DNA-binding CsgD family transcriptional regulator/PAS domain-containing protein